MFKIISQEFEMDIIQALLLVGPLVYVIYALSKAELSQTEGTHEPKMATRGFLKIFHFIASVSLTTLWIGEIEGMRKNEFGDVLILIYWVGSMRVFLDKDKPAKNLLISMMSTASLGSQLYVELYTAWIAIVIFIVLIVMTIMNKENHSVSNTLLIAVSSQVSVIYYFSRMECVEGFEILLESMSVLSSVGASLFFFFIKRESRITSSFYACMVFITMTVMEHYSTCISQETHQWFTLALIVLYLHLTVLTAFNHEEISKKLVTGGNEEKRFLKIDAVDGDQPMVESFV